MLLRKELSRSVSTVHHRQVIQFIGLKQSSECEESPMVGFIEGPKTSSLYVVG